MEMIPMLARHGFKYVLVDSIYLKPSARCAGRKPAIVPYLARFGGAEIIVVPRDRDLSNAQLSGLDPGWFQNEIHERTKHCDFPALVTTWTDGENGGWFRTVQVESGFWGFFYKPILDRYRAGRWVSRPFTSANICAPLPADGGGGGASRRVEHRASLGRRLHAMDRFAPAKRAGTNSRNASAYYWQVKRNSTRRPKTGERRRNPSAHRANLRSSADGGDELQFYWGSRWVHRSFDGMEQTYHLLDTAMQKMR